MDLMNADFNNDDLTDWLTIAWKCSQSPKNTVTSSLWAEQPAEKGTVPEVFQAPPVSNSVSAFWRSIFILTWRGVSVLLPSPAIRRSYLTHQLLSYMRNVTGLCSPPLSNCRSLIQFLPSAYGVRLVMYSACLSLILLGCLPKLLAQSWLPP